LPALESKGKQVLPIQTEGLELGELRELMDQKRTQHPDAVLVLSSTKEGKASLLVSVPKALVDLFDAGALLKAMLPHVEGRGGGKKDLAQGGGSKPEGLPAAFQALRDSI
jgi:alanyl-tRNA synthetase